MAFVFHSENLTLLKTMAIMINNLKNRYIQISSLSKTLVLKIFLKEIKLYRQLQQTAVSPFRAHLCHLPPHNSLLIYVSCIFVTFSTSCNDSSAFKNVFIDK